MDLSCLSLSFTCYAPTLWLSTLHSRVYLYWFKYLCLFQWVHFSVQSSYSEWGQVWGQATGGDLTTYRIHCYSFLALKLFLDTWCRRGFFFLSYGTNFFIHLITLKLLVPFHFKYRLNVNFFCDWLYELAVCLICVAIPVPDFRQDSTSGILMKVSEKRKRKNTRSIKNTPNIVI